MNNNSTLNTANNLIMHMYGNEGSLTSLSVNCNVPVEFVRKFIRSLLKNPILSEWISANGFHDETAPDNSVAEAFRDNEILHSKALLSGEYDDWSWKIELYGLKSDYLLSLTALEYASLKDFIRPDFSFKRNAVFEIKNSLAKSSKWLHTNLHVIQEAILDKKAIEFTYKQKDGKIVLKCGFPIAVFTNVSDNWIYFSLDNGHNYRLDWVGSLSTNVIGDCPLPKIIENPYKDYIWGASYTNNAKPEHVKVLIADATRNVLQKIKNDTRHRSGICNLYELDGRYYYEDDIIGLDEFKRWLRSFGSSVQVLEPKYVREEIITSTKKTLEYYAESEAWKNV